MVTSSLVTALRIASIGAAVLLVENSWALKPSEYAKGDQVCYRTGGRRNFELCREPVSPQELEAARIQGAQRDSEASEYRRREARLASCSFSLLSSWPGEIERLSKRLGAAKFALQYSRSELAEGYSDLSKQQYLPSSAIREAREKVAFFSRMVADQNREIAGIEWCIECARLRQAGAKACD